MCQGNCKNDIIAEQKEILLFFLSRNAAFVARCCERTIVKLSGKIAPPYGQGVHTVSLLCALFLMKASCPSGEIGRHSGLKIRRLPERGRTGSIPVSGTIVKSAIPLPETRNLLR